MKPPRYLLCPGLVRSRFDGDAHLVTAPILAALYGVPMADCVVLPASSPSAFIERRTLLNRAICGELVALYPRVDGVYPLPEAVSWPS